MRLYDQPRINNILFRALKTINLSKLDYDGLTLSQARKMVDLDLQQFDYLGKVTRQWMVINLGKDEEQKCFKWKVNTEYIQLLCFCRM